MDQYYPGGDKTDSLTVMSYTAAQALVQVLKQSGDDLTRENVLRQAANLHELRLGMLLPGITINTDPTEYAPLKQMQMMRFTGEHWKLFGPIMKGDLLRSRRQQIHSRIAATFEDRFPEIVATRPEVLAR